MNFKSLFNKFKEPIFKDDLKYVLLNGILAAIFMGALMGAIEGIISLINFPISFCMFLIGILIGKRLSKTYYSYHILYSVLAVVFSLVGYLFYVYIYNVFYLGNFIAVSRVFFSSDFIKIIFGSLNPFNGTYSVINLLIFILMLIGAFKVTKGRN